MDTGLQEGSTPAGKLRCFINTLQYCYRVVDAVTEVQRPTNIPLGRLLVEFAHISSDSLGF